MTKKPQNIIGARNIIKNQRMRITCYWRWHFVPLCTMTIFKTFISHPVEKFPGCLIPRTALHAIGREFVGQPSANMCHSWQIVLNTLSQDHHNTKINIGHTNFLTPLGRESEKWIGDSSMWNSLHRGRYNGGLRPVSLGSTHEKETDIGLSAT